MRGRGGNEDALTRSNLELATLLAGQRMLETPSDRSSSLAFEEHLVDERAREDGSTFAADFGYVVEIRALLAELAAALKALPRAFTALHVSAHDMGVVAHGFAAQHGETVGVASCSPGHLFDAELSLDIVLKESIDSRKPESP